MSGKRKKKLKRNKSTLTLKITFIVLAVVCLMLIMILLAKQFNNKDTIQDTEKVEQNQVEDIQIELVEEKDISINLGHGVYITDIGKYTGAYMEDGTNDIVSGVMMIVVENQGDESIQYAEITVPVGEVDASFSMSTLTPGSRMVLLEKTRMKYEEEDYTTAMMENVAIFEEALSLHEEELQIQILDGAINVTNISGEDISEDVVIYYKNSAPDVFYGGITYRVRLEGGLKKDEIKQVMASHFSESGSSIMFVTCGENG